MADYLVKQIEKTQIAKPKNAVANIAVQTRELYAVTTTNPAGPPGPPGKYLVSVDNVESFTALYNYYYGVNLASGDVTVSIPTAVGFAGQQIIVCIETGGAGRLILDSLEFIGAYPSGTIIASAAGTFIYLISDGVQWRFSYFSGLIPS